MGRRRAGRECRSGRHRRRLARRTSNRKPQPSILRRALSGSGHRSRRDPQRHLHDGSPAYRPVGFASLRTPRPGPQPLFVQGRRGRDRRIRKRRRGADRRRRGRLCRALLSQSPRQRDVPGVASPRATGSGNGRAGRNGGSAARSRYRARRDWWGVGARLGVIRGRVDEQAPVGSGRRPVRGEEADRGLSPAVRRGSGGRSPGPGRRRLVVRHLGAGGSGRGRDRSRPRRGAHS